MSKQTAIRWLVEQMINQGYFDCNKPLTFTNLDHLQHQALQMERKQITDAYSTYAFDEHGMRIHASQYYNETYGGKDE
jgi:hypothetical protein